MARLNFKRAVTKIIVKLQAYKFNQYILRTQACKQNIKKLLPNMPEHHTDADEDVYFGEDYYDEFHDDSDEEEIMDDPYAEAERLGRLKAKEKANKRNQYMNKGRSSPFKINNGQLDA